MEKIVEINGTKVYLNGTGKKVIVMIHGWPDTHEIWHKQVDFFKKEDYTCVTFTLPGFAFNDERVYTKNQIIQKIKEIVDKTSPNSKVIMFLHDWGCVFGYEYAMQNPERIKKMVSIDIGDANSKNYIKSLSISAIILMITYQIILAFGWIIKSNWIHKKMAKLIKAKSNFNNIHAGMGLPYAMKWVNAGGGFGKLKSINPTFPFYYIYGLKKPFFFHSSQWIEKIRSNPFNKVEAFNSSHWVMVDLPDKFNQSVKNWL